MNISIRLLNITLLLLCITLGVLAAWIFRQPSVQVDIPYNEEIITSDESMVSSQTVQIDSSPSMADEESASLTSKTSIIEPSLKDVTEAVQTLPPTTYRAADISSMVADHPFAREAAKILSGGLAESDSANRREILNYCEHFRSAYPTRDIDFLRQVFSNDALIIVGHTVSTNKSNESVVTTDNVRYNIRTKGEYLDRLSKIFKANKTINMQFSDFHIMRHPSIEGIYGVTLRQKYSSDSYSDDGFLFLLWDFRNRSMPTIHVRTWQPASSVTDSDEIIDLSDFNLQ